MNLRLAAIVVLAAGGAAPAADAPDFGREVAPLLERHCLRCHNAETRKGELSLATRDDLTAGGHVVPGQPDDSRLLKLVAPTSPEKRSRMPKDGTPLSTEQVATLRRWVAAGAPWRAGMVLKPALKADRSWWSLRPLADPQPPAQSPWTVNPIDAFVLARLRERGLSPSPPAERPALLRRLTYDLTGLPPTPEEVDAYVNDTSPDAYERQVERLLASPHYGEKWGRHWLDVVRFGESTGYERNVILDNAWPFRDYVVRSFNADVPFDRLIREHLAGDVIGRGDPTVEVGAGFLVGGPYDNVGNQDAAQAAAIRADTLDEIVRTTSEAFLGMTVGCARCHDHKFDPIPTADYYCLAATFAGVHHGSRVIATDEVRRDHAARLRPVQQRRDALRKERDALKAAIQQRAEAKAKQYEARWVRPSVDRRGTEEAFPAIEAAFVRLTVDGRDDNPDARTGFHIDEFEVWTAGAASRNVALATHGARATGASRVAEDFVDAYSAGLTIDGQHGADWIAAGPELTIALARPERVHRIAFSAGRRDATVRPPFVGDYRIEVSTDGQSWRQVAGSRDRRPAGPMHRRKRLLDLEATPEEAARLVELAAELPRAEQAVAAIPPLPSWWVGEFRPAPGPFHVFRGGDPQKKGTAVHAASPSMLADVAHGYQLPDAASEAERRLALAQWLAAADNPLTPRVLANRLWHWHFGTGLVATPSDFGAMGEKPSHPELLDWLACQVHAHEWHLKPLHRLIVTSQTYRQSSGFRADAAKVDGDNRLLWRFPPRRVSGEELRDALLAVSGRLDRRMGGPGFRLYRYLEDNVATYVPLDAPGPETYRRAVYHQNARAARVDLLSDFDCPDPAFATPRRAATTTPMQALTLLNHRFTLDMAAALAERLRREAGDDPADQVRRAFALAFGRPPASEEIDAAAALIRQHGLPAFCRALLSASELVTLD